MQNRTRQRTAIRAVLKAENRPLTADEIHRLAQQKIDSIGLSTVYRTIRRMVEARELVGVDFPGQPVRYEPATDSAHSHFVCSACDKVFDLPESDASPSLQLPPGFTYHGYDLVIFGFCATCSTESD